MLAVLGDFVVYDANLLGCMCTAFTESLLEEFVALLKGFFASRGDIEDLAKTGVEYMNDTGWSSTYLEGDIFPMDRVDGFDDRYGRLEISTTTIELAVEGDIFWKFLGRGRG